MSVQSDKCPLVSAWYNEQVGEYPTVIYDRIKNNYRCIFNSGFHCELSYDLVDKMLSQEDTKKAELSDEYKHNHFQEVLDYAHKEKGFVKNDSGKLQWSLLPFNELQDVVKVLMLGAKKYTPDNWKKCDDVTRYKDALMRHIISYIRGETEDDESHLSHLAHAICNCLFLMYFDNREEKK